MNSLRMPDRVMLNGRRVIEKINEGKWGSGDVSVSLERRGETLGVSLRSPSIPVKELVFVFSGEMDEEASFLGDQWERAYGDLSFKKRSSCRVMPWYFVMDTGKEASYYGVKTGAAAMCSWEVKGKDLYLHLDTRNGACAVELGNRELHVCDIVCDVKKGDAFKGMFSFTKKLCDDCIYDGNPIYGANNWYYAYGNSSRREILEDAAYLSEMTKGLKNRPFMVIDDGWQEAHEGSYNGGPWRRANADYGDMKEIALSMKKNNVRPGIWVRPLYDDHKNFDPGWRLERDSNVLDISVPEVLEYIAEDVRTIRDWGYELLKYDFSTFDIYGKWGASMGRTLTNMGGWHFKDRTKTNAELIRNFYRVIYENAGDMLILGCNCMGHLGTGYMHLNRTGDDTSGREWERTKKYGVNTLAFRLPQHNAFYGADADCVGITDSIPWEKNRQWLELLSLSGTPFFVSVKPHTLTKEREEELKAAYALASENRKTIMPLDVHGTKTPREYETVKGYRRYKW
ncbi:MAG: alpha-galactosidase [Lachnospiraceae bacterium]|nr:alpha-galactosidase [Lachnospiraceae bacterium]